MYVFCRNLSILSKIYNFVFLFFSNFESTLQVIAYPKHACIIKGYLHLSKTTRVTCTSVSFTIRLLSSRFSKINCEPIFHLVRVSSSYVYREILPAILKKTSIDIASVSLKTKLDSRKWTLSAAPCTHGLT